MDSRPGRRAAGVRRQFGWGRACACAPKMTNERNQRSPDEAAKTAGTGRWKNTPGSRTPTPTGRTRRSASGELTKATKTSGCSHRASRLTGGRTTDCGGRADRGTVSPAQLLAVPASLAQYLTTSQVTLLHTSALFGAHSNRGFYTPGRISAGCNCPSLSSSAAVCHLRECVRERAAAASLNRSHSG